MADMKKYQHVHGFLEKNSERFMGLYPRLVGETMRDYLTVDTLSKREKQKKIMARVSEKRSLLGLLGDAWRFWKAFK